MNNRTKEFLRKCQFPLLIIFATVPIPLLLYAAFAPEHLHFCWIMPMLYGLFTVLSFLIPGKYRLRYGIAAAILLVILGASMLRLTPSTFLLIVPVLYSGLLLWGLPMAGWSSGEELPGALYWGGILIHIAAQVVNFVVGVFTSPFPEVVSPLLLIGFFAFAVLGMVSMTRGNMSSASNGRQSPASMQRKNMLLTLICFSVAMLVALMPAIIQAIKDFFTWLAALLYKVFSSGSENTEAPVATQPPVMDTEMLPAAQEESGLLADILNVLFLILGTILIVAVVIAVLKAALKALRKLWRHLMSNLSDYVANTAEDYVDEVSDTRSAAPRQKKPRLSSADERAMSPAQRIRYRYLRLLYRHREWGHGSTARENLPQGAASLYERARYSDHPITEEEAARFTSETKRV